MNPVLLIDFGSTYTKLTAVDTDSSTLLGTSAAYTTVETDINDGLARARSYLDESIGKRDYAAQWACSSAAGGLRMAVSGLIPELTAKAAGLAALGAGAKVTRVFSHELTSSDIAEIDRIKPDIFLLTGGTDGGNGKVIRANAKKLTTCKHRFPIVIAGNRSAADDVEEILADFSPTVCPNVMPRLGEIDILPVQNHVRDLFLKRIIQAKGLSDAKAVISGIVMPTPAAMLQAMELLAQGTDTSPGVGDLIGVDVGGATTDVYSIAKGMPTGINVVYKGLPEPVAKRTVEGDIGMRYSLGGIIAAGGLDRVVELSGLAPATVEYLGEELSVHTDVVPGDNADIRALDFALAALAVEVGVGRHAGKLEEVYTPMGQVFEQTGKDLRDVKLVVATGGSIIHAERADEILSHALYHSSMGNSLRPSKAQFAIDRKYILSAMGVLAEHYPDVALRIMKKELQYE